MRSFSPWLAIASLTISVLTTPLAAQARGDAVRSFQPALATYYELKNALLASNAKTTRVQATTLISLLRRIDTMSLPAKARAATRTATASAKQMSTINDLAVQRKQFKTLSANIITLVKTIRPAKTYVQFCPMANASWLSDTATIANPYYGGDMRACGRVTDTIPGS
jgi:hypothetical protein